MEKQEDKKVRLYMSLGHKYSRIYEDIIECYENEIEKNLFNYMERMRNYPSNKEVAPRAKEIIIPYYYVEDIKSQLTLQV